MEKRTRFLAALFICLILWTASAAAAPNPKAAKLLKEGQALIAQNMLDEGQRKIEQAIAADPNFGLAHNELGILCANQGRLDEAVTAFRNAARCEPSNPGPLINLAITLLKRSRQGDAEEGLKAVTRALEMNPQNLQVRDIYSIYLEKQGNIDGAIEEMKKIKEAAPRNEKMLERLMRLYAKKGDRQSTLAVISELKSINPGNEQALELEQAYKSLPSGTPASPAGPSETPTGARKGKLKDGLTEKLGLILPLVGVLLGLAFFAYLKIRSHIDTGAAEVAEVPDFTPEFRKPSPAEAPDRYHTPFAQAVQEPGRREPARKTKDPDERRCYEVVNCPLSNRQECPAHMQNLDCWDLEGTPCCSKDRTLCIVCPSYTARLQTARKMSTIRIESASSDLFSEIARPEMSLLSHVSRALGSTSNQEELYSIVLDEMMKVSTCREAALFIFDREWENVKLVKSRTHTEVPLPNFRFTYRGPFKDWFDSSTFPIMKREFEQNPYWKAAFPADARIFLSSHFEIVYPLKTNNNAFMGLIFLGPKMTGSLYTKEERNLAGLVVNLSSEALERVKSYEMAIFDGLTNLYVKRYFNERIREEVNNATYNLQALSLILTDIDHFKKFNDTYGHQQGDVVLREVARIIKESLRSGRDVPARYGGEEMAVILPDSESHRAFEVADRIRRNIEASQFPGLPVGVKVTASFGVASFPLNADNPDDLVKKADMALYAAKRNGRNQVVLFDEATMK